MKCFLKDILRSYWNCHEHFKWASVPDCMVISLGNDITTTFVIFVSQNFKPYRTVLSYFILFLGASPISAIQVHNLGVVAKNSLLENGGKILIIVHERGAHSMWGRDRRIWRTHDVISSIRTLKSNVDHKIALFSMCISWHVFNIVSLWLHHIYMWLQKSRIHASCFYTYF